MKRTGAALAICCSLALSTGIAGAQNTDTAGAKAAPAQSGPVILMGLLTIKPGHVKDFVALFVRMKQRAQHQDHGNLRYELFSSAPMASSSASNPTARTFVFIEGWRSQADFTAHGKWAGPIVRSSWKEMSENEQFMRLNELPAR